MSDPISGLTSWVGLLLASLGVLVPLAGLTPPMPTGRHRRTAAPTVRPRHRPVLAPGARRPLGVHEGALDGTANRSVRPYVLCGTEAA
ncbi:hypothetical protein C6Y14_34750 [Streptomyces dioscori]|uniref:Uncharacterized protein n=1 Tax=Streptomyces dioscori TaxID=2109333 RepID=A0A2P8PXM3_9ACTN|nr:hypothetical protein [Streptomyces dioscori]PSM38745.1 hypothetical protein C6Y14_34750 [Streptomyces dioscori]